VIHDEAKALIEKLTTHSHLRNYKTEVKCLLEGLATYYEEELEQQYKDLTNENFVIQKQYIKLIAEREPNQDLQSTITQLAFRVKKLEEWASS
jgi:hypothetical protein